MQKRRILLLTLTVLLLAATLASALLADRLERKSQILKESDIKTGLQNNTVAFDESRNLVFMGAYVNRVTAFRGATPVWTFNTNGTVVRLIVRPEL